MLVAFGPRQKTDASFTEGWGAGIDVNASVMRHRERKTERQRKMNPVKEKKICHTESLFVEFIELREAFYTL